MAGPNPLDLPEIRDLLARHLTHQELTVCARISREWHLTFEPHIWKTIKILPQNTFRSKVIAGASLKGHSDFIERLVCVEEGGEYLKDLDCPHIKALSLKWKCPFQRDFAFRHRTTVQSLSLNIQDLKDEVWDFILSFPALESLSLKRAHITEPNLSSFRSLWLRLRCLHLDQFEFRMGDPGQEKSYNRARAIAFLEELPRSAIRELKLITIFGLSTKEPLMFLKACPLLETFTWSPNPNNQDDDCPLGNDIDEVGSYLTEQAQHCPRLVSLTGMFEEEEKKAILLFLKSRSQLPLEQLSIHSTWFSEISWKQLKEYHLSTLRLLNLQNCSVDGKVIQDILCSLPKLETLVGSWLRDYDIDSRPWICSGLMRLTVCVDLTKEVSQRMIFLRLAKLTRLKYLDLTRTSKYLTDHSLKAKVVGQLKFTMIHGLELLKTLVNLEQLCLCDTGQLLRKEDVKWMLENWLRLRTVDGSLAKRTKVGERAEGALDPEWCWQGLYRGLEKYFHGRRYRRGSTPENMGHE